MARSAEKIPAKSGRKTALEKSAEPVKGVDARRLEPGTPPSERKEKLLRIAARWFSEFGFEATTIREIAADADILSGSIFYHFETKEEMLHVIIRDAVISMRENTVRIANASNDAEQKLVALTLWYFEALFEHQEAFAILYNERKYFRANPAFEYVFAAKTNLYSAWKTVLHEGIAQDLFRPDMDIYQTIITIIRMLNTCADWLRHTDEYETEAWRYDQESVTQFNLDFILHAVRKASRINKRVPLKAAERLLREPVSAA